VIQPLLLRVPEAAQLLGISRSKTYEMIAAGELPAIKVRDSLRIPLADLQQWIEAQKESHVSLTEGNITGKHAGGRNDKRPSY
jgi:excisionase family DNA binding protein